MEDRRHQHTVREPGCQNKSYKQVTQFRLQVGIPAEKIAERRDHFRGRSIRRTRTGKAYRLYEPISPLLGDVTFAAVFNAGCCCSATIPRVKEELVNVVGIHN